MSPLIRVSAAGLLVMCISSFAYASHPVPIALMDGVERGLCNGIVMLIRALPNAPNKKGTAAQLRSLLSAARARPEASRGRIAHCVWDGTTGLGAAVRALLVSQKVPKVKVPGGYDTVRALVILLSKWIQPGTRGCFNFFFNKLTLGGVTEPLEAADLAEKLCQSTPTEQAPTEPGLAVEGRLRGVVRSAETGSITGVLHANLVIRGGKVFPSSNLWTIHDGQSLEDRMRQHPLNKTRSFNVYESGVPEPIGRFVVSTVGLCSATNFAPDCGGPAQSTNALAGFIVGFGRVEWTRVPDSIMWREFNAASDGACSAASQVETRQRSQLPPWLREVCGLR